MVVVIIIIKRLSRLAPSPSGLRAARGGNGSSYSDNDSLVP